MYMQTVKSFISIRVSTLEHRWTSASARRPHSMASIPPADRTTPEHYNEYKTWTNEQLIARVTDLESQLRAQNKSFSAKQSKTSGTYSLKKSRPKKEFDPSKYSTRFIALKIAYLGQRYNGFEHHANNNTPLPTVEEELWKAFMKTKLISPSGYGEVSWEGCDYSKCGRTDKGVSAFGQVIGIRVRSSRPKKRQPVEEGTTSFGHGSVDPGETLADDDLGHEGEQEPQLDESPTSDSVYNELCYPRILNRVLPTDIRVLAWCPSPPPDFNARFSCKERRYHYFFTQPAHVPLPNSAGLVKRIDGTSERDGWLNIRAMQEAANHFVGLHDFRNFCKLDPARQITNFERRIFHARIEEAESCQGLVNFLNQPHFQVASLEHEIPKVYVFTLHGSAFLWHQVRHMMAILFLVGQGFEMPAIVSKLLDVSQTPSKPIYDMADDAPLVLWDCIFPAWNGDPHKDGLRWVYPDEQAEASDGTQAPSTSGDGRYGPGGINEVLWTGWRKSKMDEILAGSLLDVVAAQRSSQTASTFVNVADSPDRTPCLSLKLSASTRVFEGGNSPRFKKQHVPLMNRTRQDTPEVINARYLIRKAAGDPSSGLSPTPSASGD